ncbi:uncharacterized protein BJ171DRAFT_503858 [Polychytrium aggregatum]|uniref:uncharacterized protein n=1 Tax=Polychytrium aggregatum TaxID=110093 RepID=UPI0022FF0A03|nr:uncharacterized protein BJ171DRAFT_503858 [Polychytrium aggregatum]KAI9204862.1 hypothetical protein BJ171DRAFT_503858 [Polychytrium aggregatum]
MNPTLQSQSQSQSQSQQPSGQIPMTVHPSIASAAAAASTPSASLGQLASPTARSQAAQITSSSISTSQFSMSSQPLAGAASQAASRSGRIPNPAAFRSTVAQPASTMLSISPSTLAINPAAATVNPAAMQSAMGAFPVVGVPPGRPPILSTPIKNVLKPDIQINANRVPYTSTPVSSTKRTYTKRIKTAPVVRPHEIAIPPPDRAPEDIAHNEEIKRRFSETLKRDQEVVQVPHPSRPFASLHDAVETLFSYHILQGSREAQKFSEHEQATHKRKAEALLHESQQLVRRFRRIQEKDEKAAVPRYIQKFGEHLVDNNFPSGDISGL